MLSKILSSSALAANLKMLSKQIPADELEPEAAIVSGESRTHIGLSRWTYFL